MRRWGKPSICALGFGLLRRRPACPKGQPDFNQVKKAETIYNEYDRCVRLLPI